MLTLLVASLIHLTGVIQDNQYTVTALAGTHKFVDISEEPIWTSSPK